MAYQRKTKRCLGCGINRSRALFGMDAGQKDGLNTRCMDCMRGYYATGIFPKAPKIPKSKLPRKAWGKVRK